MWANQRSGSFPSDTHTQRPHFFAFLSFYRSRVVLPGKKMVRLRASISLPLFRTKVGALFLRAPFGVSEPENCAVLDLCSAHVGAAEAFSAAVPLSTSSAFYNFLLFSHT
jgi:hypothetical protein